MKAPLTSLKAAGMLVFGIFAIIAVASAGWAGTPEHVESVQNESITMDVGSYHSVDEANRTAFVSAFDNETVRSGNNTLAEGQDYQWNASDGTIKFLNSTDTSDGQSAEIDYAFEAKSEDAAKWHGPPSALISVLPVFALAAVVVLIAGLLYWAGDLLTSPGRRF